MATTKMQIVGAENISALLTSLEAVPARRVARNALNAGARIIRKQAKANLSANGAIDTGLLQSTLSISKKGSNAAKTVVTLRASGKLYMVQRKDKKTGHIRKPARARPAKYAHFIEYGTEHSKAEPFLRPAVDSKNQEAIAAIIDSAAKGIVREANKIGLKAK